MKKKRKRRLFLVITRADDRKGKGKKGSARQLDLLHIGKEKREKKSSLVFHLEFKGKRMAGEEEEKREKTT